MLQAEQCDQADIYGGREIGIAGLTAGDTPQKRDGGHQIEQESDHIDQRCRTEIVVDDAVEQYQDPKIPNQKGYEYHPTRSCSELLPIIKALGDWGIRWARSNLTEKEYDVELLMLYLKRSINPENLIGSETTIRFKFTDIKTFPDWWIMVKGSEIDLCVNDPGKDVDVYFTTTVKTMAEVWMGDTTYRKAMASDALKVVGPDVLLRDISAWLEDSIFAGVAPANEI